MASPAVRPSASAPDLKVYSAVEQVFSRLKGNARRGVGSSPIPHEQAASSIHTASNATSDPISSSHEPDDELSRRHRAFRLRSMRAEQHGHEDRLRTRMATSYVEGNLESKDDAINVPLIGPRPLRRFADAKVLLRLVHHMPGNNDAAADDYAHGSERVTQRLVAVASSLRPTRFEALDSWVRSCLGIKAETVVPRWQRA